MLRFHFHLTHPSLQVGVTKFISGFSGFRGIIKQRYSDFLVNECDKNGEIVHLSSTDPSCDEVKGTSGEESMAAQVELKKVLGDDMVDKLAALNDGPGEPIVLEASDDKAARSALHKLITTSFEHLASNTCKSTVQGRTSIRVEFSSRGQSRQALQRKDSYCHFVLFKTNKDTISAVSLLSRMTHSHVGRFSYAGTKDRRAITVQRVAVQGLRARQLAGLNRRLIGIRCGTDSFCMQCNLRQLLVW
jgi:tRNA pseudouridine13 synthase